MKIHHAGIFGALAIAILAAGCTGAPELAPASRPLPRDTLMLLGKKGMNSGAPIFVRIFKEESELELWKQRDDGHFYHFKTYPICTWSGDLGPKMQQGDRQAPEGFYTITKAQMNPNSLYHLAFNIGFPNAFDRSQGRTGSALMVHGKCKSAGCYAMTDALIEEIYALARETFDAGEPSFQLHAYPFRMTEANMNRHGGSPWMPFWKTLKDGYDQFEATRIPPEILVCGKQYHVNVKPLQRVADRIDPVDHCPRLRRQVVPQFVPRGDQQLAEQHITAHGVKKRNVASARPPSSSGDGIGSLITRDWTSTPVSALGFSSRNK
jgi:murein L,D-transpeptidase YafK